MNCTVVVMSQPPLPLPSSCQGRVLSLPLLSLGLSQALLLLCGALGLVLVLRGRGALGLVLRGVLGLLLLRKSSIFSAVKLTEVTGKPNEVAKQPAEAANEPAEASK